jgi:hypothetical protein
MALDTVSRSKTILVAFALPNCNSPEESKYCRSIDTDSFRFLDPSQLSKAQNLARFTDIQDAHNPETIARGVTKYLRSLRERAFESVGQNPGWATGNRLETQFL